MIWNILECGCYAYVKILTRPEHVRLALVHVVVSLCSFLPQNRDEATPLLKRGHVSSHGSAEVLVTTGSGGFK